MRAVLWVLVINLFLLGVGCTMLAVVMSISLARRGNHRPRTTWSLRGTRGLAAAAFVLVVIPVGGLLLLPSGSSSTTTSTSTTMTSTPGVTSIEGVASSGMTDGSVRLSTSTESFTLIESEGGSVLFVLAIPVIVAGLGAAVRGRWEHPMRIACGWFLFAGSILAIASIGLLFLPAAAILTIAGALTPSAEGVRVRREPVLPA